MNRKSNIKRTASLILAVLCLCINGCSDDTFPPEEPGNTNTETDKKEEVIFKIAIILPLSDSEMKQRWEQTIDWAIRNFDQAQHYDKKLVLEPEWYDEDTADLAALARKLSVREDIHAIIGPLYSANVKVVAQQCVVTRKPLIAPQATSADLVRLYSEEGFLWTLAETDISQCEVLLSLAIEKNAKTVSLIASSGMYGQTFIDWFAFQAVEMGLTVGEVIQYAPGTLAYDMKRIQEKQSDIIICIPDNTTEIRTMLEEYDKNGSAKLLFPDNAYSPVVLKELGDLAEGMEGVSMCADPESGFGIAYEVYFNEKPTMEAHIYDSILLTFLAAYQTMLHGGNDFNAALQKVVSGEISMQQGMWLPTLFQVLLIDIEAEAYLCPWGASSLLQFDEKVYTTVLHSTYTHWLAYQNKFLNLGYHTTSGSHRTSSTLAGWNWKINHEQTFDESGNQSEYPALNEQWALVVAASESWTNYRHQADALAFYQLLKKSGYDDEHIILIAEDDLADNPSNPEKGVIKISPSGDNLYHDLAFDYRLSELSPNDINSILLGEQSDRLKAVIRAKANDNLLVFWSGHGLPGQFLWGEESAGYTAELASGLFQRMHEEKKYRKMLWLIESCYAGSVAKECEGIPGILCITASDEWEKSKAAVPYNGIWLTNRFTQTLLEELNADARISLRNLYYKLFHNTMGSHVKVYNDKNYGSIYQNTMEEYL